METIKTYSEEWSELMNILTKLFKNTINNSHLILLSGVAFNKMKDPNRHYHSIGHHILPMLNKIIQYGDVYNWTERYIESLYWAALFHDAVYDVRESGGKNEQDSANLWYEACAKYYPEYNDADLVNQMILATFGHESQDSKVRGFLELDLGGFGQSFDKILEDELLIRKEYEYLDWEIYRKGRIDFLKKYAHNSIIEELYLEDTLRIQCEYMRFVKPNIAVMAGSYASMFHVGHYDVLKKAEAIFDKVIIVCAENPTKPLSENFKNKVIPDVLKNHQVEFVQGSIMKWIEALPYEVTMVRGLRNATDLQYEQDYLTWLNEVATKPVKFVSIFADSSLAHISSSNLRVLQQVDPDKASKFILK